MPKTRTEAGKSNFAERGIRFLRDFHIGLGALALAGSVVFAPLTAIAAYEGINALAHEGLRQVVKPRSQKAGK